jgi:hypothetical protein
MLMKARKISENKVVIFVQHTRNFKIAYSTHGELYFMV